MNKLKHIIFLLAIVLTGFSLTACNEEDNLNTDQFGNEVSLESFGPCPVLRGGTLHLIGTNLDQVSEIDLPGADPITQYEVLKSGRQSEITIQVPAEKCDTGKIVLKTQKGGTITSITSITYREDIKLDDFYVGAEGTKVGSVGDILTIKGDYLNLIHGIVFTEKDTVYEDQFTTHDRYTIQVPIDAKAKTGTFKLIDRATPPNEIETKEALTINLPEVQAITPAKAKAGATMTVKGDAMDQIASVKLQGAEVGDSDFVSQSATSLSFALPLTATDGEVTLITKSGVEIPAGSITTVVPTELEAAPAPVKNGAELTVTGKDLDLVTSATFPNVDEAQSLKSGSASKIVIVVPEKAQEGNLSLNLANGKTVPVAYTLVKPTVKSFTPASVVAGNKVMLRGTNLDLVESVSFPGENTLTAAAADTKITSSAIGTTIPKAAYGEGCTLNLKNGTKVECKGLTVVAATTPAIAGAAEGVIGKYATVQGTNFNNIEQVYIGKTKVTKFREKTNTSMTFQVPASVAAGSHDLIFITPAGEKVVAGKFNAKSPETDVATITTNMGGSAITYPYNFTWDDTGRFRINRADLEKIGVKKGSKLLFYKAAGATGQVQINDANWGNSVTVADWTGDVNPLVVEFDDAMMARIKTSDGWSDTALILQGDLKSITKIAILP